jgi:hypothetical protein
MQGDISRAKQKERERLRNKPDFSRIMSGVDDMRLHDLDAGERENLSDYENRIEYEDPVSNHMESSVVF